MPTDHVSSSGATLDLVSRKFDDLSPVGWTAAAVDPMLAVAREIRPRATSLICSPAHHETAQGRETMTSLRLSGRVVLDSAAECGLDSGERADAQDSQALRQWRSPASSLYRGRASRVDRRNTKSASGSTRARVLAALKH
jgi:hypothetical protein